MESEKSGKVPTYATRSLSIKVKRRVFTYCFLS